MNKKRNPYFFNLKHKINACKTLEKLNSLRQVTLRYHKDHIDDGGALLTIFALKEQSLCVDYRNEKEYEERKKETFDYEEDSQESLWHKRTCGFNK